MRFKSDLMPYAFIYKMLNWIYAYFPELIVLARKLKITGGVKILCHHMEHYFVHATLILDHIFKLYILYIKWKKTHTESQNDIC